jgi:ribonucleoside-diphosphate reductase beta chain
MSLVKGNIGYKPFAFEWAFAAYELQNKLHWLPAEISLSDDIRDYNLTLTLSERNLITHIFRLFTENDSEVENAYIDKYLPYFKPTEVRMMLLSFANMESIHMNAYSYLLDTLGLPEIEYSKFLDYKEMTDKVELMKLFDTSTRQNMALTLAFFAAFVEGLQLFASFAILLNFPRFNKLKGMGQIVTFSVRDETAHVENMIYLYKTFCQEFKAEIDKLELERNIVDICAKVVENEDRFIDLAFELGDIEGLSSEDVKSYI